MSYRQSSFDPLAPSAPVGPKRPFNWVQWLGVGCEAAALGILLWHFSRSEEHTSELQSH